MVPPHATLPPKLHECLACLQTILTSRAAVLGVGGAGLLLANVQSGSLIEEHYKKQVSLSAGRKLALTQTLHSVEQKAGTAVRNTMVKIGYRS